MAPGGPSTPNMILAARQVASVDQFMESGLMMRTLIQVTAGGADKVTGCFYKGKAHAQVFV